MNYLISVTCDVCEEKTNCRLGLSNRQYQPLRFCCSVCSSPIDITMTCDFVNAEVDIQVKGATRTDDGSFQSNENFVDLNLDFPVTFEDYVRGMTPFMRASMQIGAECVQRHMMRMDILNDVHKRSSEIKSIFTLYKNRNLNLYKEKVLSFIKNKKLPCEFKIDQNHALYFAIEIAFFPFAEPKRNFNAVINFDAQFENNEKNHPTELINFVSEMVHSGFLKNCQMDCLEIYPRVIDAELIFRPALLLDFDPDYEIVRTPYRVSAHNFVEFKDLYKDVLEIISRLLVLVAGINNLNHRGNHNEFIKKKDSPKNLNHYADEKLGKKLGHIDNSWYTVDASIIDNKFRNSIAHYKAEYDDVTQLITYYPHYEGIKQDKPETIMFLDFSRKLLEAFREMHRLHHLVKCLFVYYYLCISQTK